MLLVEGITGFSNGGVIMPKVSETEFKRSCFDISNILKFRIEYFDFNLNGKNFYFAKIMMDSVELYIMINAYHPSIAFASEISPFNNVYIYNTYLENELSKTYRVLHTLELQKGINKDELGHLNHVELQQIRYFKPYNLSEIIFNYWD